MMGYGDWGWASWIWMAGGTAFWIAVVGVIAYAVTHGSSHESTHESGATAEEILRRRYANGEIDAAEYEARLRTLRG